MNEIVLDASALLAYLYQEAGADIVDSATSMGAYISVINWAEVLSIVSLKGENVDDLASKMTQKEFGNLIILPVTEADAVQIGKLRLKTKVLGLSLGDRACLALGLRLESTVLTADKIWRNLSIGIPITTIR